MNCISIGKSDIIWKKEQRKRGYSIMEKVSLNANAARDILSLGIKTRSKINEDFKIFKSHREEKVISLGSEGNVVRSLQRLLNSL